MNIPNEITVLEGICARLRAAADIQSAPAHAMIDAVLATPEVHPELFRRIADLPSSRAIVSELRNDGSDCETYSEMSGRSESESDDGMSSDDDADPYSPIPDSGLPDDVSSRLTDASIIETHLWEDVSNYEKRRAVRLEYRYASKERRREMRRAADRDGEEASRGSVSPSEHSSHSGSDYFHAAAALSRAQGCLNELDYCESSSESSATEHSRPQGSLPAPKRPRLETAAPMQTVEEDEGPSMKDRELSIQDRMRQVGIWIDRNEDWGRSAELDARLEEADALANEAAELADEVQPVDMDPEIKHRWNVCISIHEDPLVNIDDDEEATERYFIEFEKFLELAECEEDDADGIEECWAELKKVLNDNPQYRPAYERRLAFIKVQSEQERTDPILDGNAFARLVAELTNEVKTDLPWDPEALHALQAAAEDFLVQRFEKAGRLAIHARRTYVQPKDFQLLERFGL